VALMMVALLGVAALVIDIGALYVEKRELQNGADAGALAVAQDCAIGDCLNELATAGQYADLNAKDGASAVETVCGVGPGLAACTDPPPTGAENATGWVRVGTRTETPDGGDQVGFVLAPIMNALAGATVHARAVAAWGPMGGGVATPLVFSQCEYEQYGGDITVDPPTFPAGVHAITFHGTNPAAVDCAIGPSGLDLPGGFGRVVAAGCEADLTAGQWIGVDPGNNLAAGCDVISWRNNEVLVAIFDQNRGTGRNGEYHLAGFVGFHIVGYRIVASGGGGGVQRWTAPGYAAACTPSSPSDSYLCGEFTRVSTSGSDFGTGPGFGAVIIKMVG
jgi:hypothetical protein